MRGDAIWFATVDEVDRTLSFKDDGHRTAACWVQALTNCAPSDAKRQVRVARMIRHLPAVGDALLIGHIGAAQIEALLQLWRNRRVRDVLAVLIDELIERASLMPLMDFRMVCQRVVAFADPDGAHRDHETSRANRHLSLVPDGAGFRLHAEGDAPSGAIVQEVPDRYVQAEFDTDWAAGLAEHGDRMCPALLRRTHRQRRFDGWTRRIC